ncbi:C-GCAxxG-C-C family protein [Desulfosporosinus sp. Sb-LF]|uniref:C-GCAxxG-C-C family protein n=1 Tax=Desulfosporosinus sp. Sb-LF TaxID=2560027 RepID=UPI00107F4AFD|nr:C-GCAxxG-C-C family protein [Desulfosporosinus sp. Sb-LF]TGE34591.1 C_GCAxxG_C_C family protein [Desulfosporosinus sp. Sb-LF]
MQELITLKLRAPEIAKDAMQRGLNCCESVLTAANEVWKLNLSKDMFFAASLFKEGMGSGCTCGALVGIVMASGIIRERYGLKEDQDLAKRLHSGFKQEYKSSCCAVLRKKQSFLARISQKGCIHITEGAVAILVKEWDHLHSQTLEEKSL